MSANEPIPPAAPASDKPQAAVAERPAPTRTPPRQLPQFRVLLHNDDHNDMVHVVGTLIELASLEKQKAVLVMLEAHAQGVALVLVTHKERAELIQEQFASKGLTVTIEPAE